MLYFLNCMLYFNSVSYNSFYRHGSLQMFNVPPSDYTDNIYTTGAQITILRGNASSPPSTAVTKRSLPTCSVANYVLPPCTVNHGCANHDTERKRFKSPIYCCDVTKPPYLFSGKLCTSPLHCKQRVRKSRY